MKFNMKTEKEIRKEIIKVTKDYQHVLDCGPATVEINAPRALMQISARSALDTLYGTLGEKRPKFKCDDISKQNY